MPPAVTRPEPEQRPLATLPDEEVRGEEMAEIHLLLVSLDAVLRLHMAQEEEAYLPLLEG